MNCSLRRVAALVLSAALLPWLSAQTPAAPAPAAPAAPAAPTTAHEPPRLLVLCAVDQLATWVLQRGLPFMGEDGFRRLQREGVDFTACAYQHACSETGPGHATLGTGALPSVHGIVRNEWHDQRTLKTVYCAGQPDVAAFAELPEGKGRGPAMLMVPTFGDGLKAKYGKDSKVVSIAWKDRAAILMAGKSADAVAWFEVATGRLVSNTLWSPAPPAWLLQFNADKKLAGFLGWKWELCAPAAAYADLVDDRPFEMMHLNGSRSRTLPQVVDGGNADRVTPGFFAQASFSPLNNEVTLLAVEAALAAEKLGQHSAPDMLCVSFGATDYVGHAFGPDSVEARDTLLRLDGQLARLLARLDQQVGKGHYLLALSADHGVCQPVEVSKAAGLDAGRGALQTHAKAAGETALAAHFGSREGKKPYIALAAEMALTFDRAVLQEVAGERPLADVVAEAAKVAAEAVSHVPGFHAAVPVQDLLARGAGDDPMRALLRNAVYADRTGDLLLVTKQYWLEGGTVASHGTLWPYDREVPLLAMGGGLVAGVRCAVPVTPGLGVVLMAAAVGLPRPPGALESVPPHVFVGQ